MQDPTIKAALTAAQKNEPHFIEEQIRVCEIPRHLLKRKPAARSLNACSNNSD